MMTKVLLIEKRVYNYLFVYMLLMLNIGCKPLEYSFEDLKTLSPNFSINNNDLYKIIDKVIDDNTSFDSSSNVIVIFTEKKNDSLYKISITKTDFNIFKKNKSEYYFSKLKGYLTYKKKFIILYGNTDSCLFNKNINIKMQNVMYQNKKSNEIPIIYEPNFIDYMIKI